MTVHVPAAAALVALSLIPTTAGTLQLVQLAGGPELVPAGRPVRRLPHGTHRAHRRRHPLRARGRSPVPAPVPPPPPGLAPPRRPRPDGRRPCGRRVGAVDDAPLPAETRHRRPALRLPTGVRLRDGSLPGPRLHRDPSPRHRRPPRLDDPRIRDRSRRRDPSVHRRHRSRPVRHRRTPRRPRQGRRVGHQPRHRRVGPPTPRPSAPLSPSAPSNTAHRASACRSRS